MYTHIYVCMYIYIYIIILLLLSRDVVITTSVIILPAITRPNYVYMYTFIYRGGSLLGYRIDFNTTIKLSNFYEINIISVVYVVIYQIVK